MAKNTNCFLFHGLPLIVCNMNSCIPLFKLDNMRHFHVNENNENQNNTKHKLFFNNYLKMKQIYVKNGYWCKVIRYNMVTINWNGKQTKYLDQNCKESGNVIAENVNYIVRQYNYYLLIQKTMQNICFVQLE